jgi:hypothetical protein
VSLLRQATCIGYPCLSVNVKRMWFQNAAVRASDKLKTRDLNAPGTSRFLAQLPLEGRRTRVGHVACIIQVGSKKTNCPANVDRWMLA